MSLTDKLYDKYRGEIESIQLITSSGGVFEVSLNGEKIYSKKETGDFPDEEEFVEKLGR